MSTTSTRPSDDLAARARLDLLTVYVPALRTLQDRIDQYEANDWTNPGWTEPIVAILTEELQDIEARVDALVAAGVNPS